MTIYQQRVKRILCHEAGLRDTSHAAASQVEEDSTL